MPSSDRNRAEPSHWKGWTLFLDRDGVINRKREGDYVKSWEEFEFLPGALDAIGRLSKLFFPIIVLTNQRGVARRIFTLRALMEIHKRMVQRIDAVGGRIDGIEVCPHGLDDACGCRKPSPGLALRAREKFPEIEFSRCIFAGDSPSDMEMGTKLGLFRVLIGKGPSTAADRVFKTLSSFSLWAASNRKLPPRNISRGEGKPL